MKYKIYTDSSANLTNEIIKQYNIGIVALNYINSDKIFKSFNLDSDEPIKKFYEFLRRKDNLTTSCANANDFIEVFEKDMKDGYDILYIGMSSNLSVTYSMAKLALEELCKKYPNRKGFAVDSLNASLGEGALVYYACLQKEEGRGIEDVYAFCNNTKMNVNSLFTVKTLQYLKNGGRISKLTYFFGTATDIKPIMHVNEVGKLVSLGKVMGRKRSIIALANELCKKIISPETQTIFISHGDCIDDAKYLAEIIAQKVPVKNFVYNYIDPVIGIHSGPDTLAVFFLGTSRLPSLESQQTKNDLAGYNV